MLTIFMQPFGTLVAGFALDHMLDLRFLEMTCLAALKHHRSRSVNSVTGNTVQRGPVTCPVTKVAEDLFVHSLKRPWVPGLCTCRCRCSEGEERAALRRRVAHRACAGKHLARLTYMAIVMASEASRPVAVANIIGISRPVYFHGWEDITLINPEDGVHCPVQISLLIREDLGEIFCIIGFDKVAHLFIDVLLLPVIFAQSIQGQFFDPGQFGGDGSSRHGLIHRSFGRREDMRGTVVTIHTVHEVEGQFVQFLVRNVGALVPINGLRPIAAYYLDPGNPLKATIGCPEIDFFVDRHMPMNPCVLTQIRRPASGSYEKADLLRRVLSVIAEIGILH